MKKVLQAEKARAASVFEKKCKTDKSTKQNGNQQNDEKKKKQKKRDKVSESPKKGKSFVCLYVKTTNLTCIHLSLPPQSIGIIFIELLKALKYLRNLRSKNLRKPNSQARVALDPFQINSGKIVSFLSKIYSKL